MDSKRIITAILFFAVGLGIFLWVYHDTDITTIKKELDHVKWSWIILAILLNLLSIWIRSVRWQKLFQPIQYHPSRFHLFLANIIMGFTNQIIPRGGEVARLGVISKTDKIPFSKLFGTALAERATDLAILFSLFSIIVFWQLDNVKEILHVSNFGSEEQSNGKAWIIALGFLLSFIITGIILWRNGYLEKLLKKLKKFWSELKEGFYSVKRIKGKAEYVILSVLFYVVSFIMFYVLFFAFEQTSGLSVEAAMFTFGIASVSFLLPIQSGLGAWHFLVIQSLLIFGIEPEVGKTFSLIAHALTALINLPLGGIAFLILFFITKKQAKNKKGDHELV